MRFVLFCPSGIVPAQFEALSTGSVCNITCIRTEEELRNKLWHRPQSVVIPPAGSILLPAGYKHPVFMMLVFC